MKLIDRNGRLFGKISVIDVLVLAVVAVIAVALYVKTNHRDITSTANIDTPITYQLQVEGARTYVADALQEGDLIYEQERDTGGSLGKIVDIQRSEGTRFTEFDDGTIESAVPAEDCVNLLLTVEGKGLISDSGYMLNRVYSLGVNSARTLCTKYVNFVATVVSIMP